MTRFVKKNFIYVSCKKCERPLASVIIGTETMCPACNTWTVALQTVKKKERCKA